MFNPKPYKSPKGKQGNEEPNPPKPTRRTLFLITPWGLGFRVEGLFLILPWGLPCYQIKEFRRRLRVRVEGGGHGDYIGI